MEPIFSLALQLPPRGSREVLRALHGQLKAAILDGRLQPGLRLPATRVLADSLQVSRNTALATYDLLLSEGYLVARPGAGTFVADVLPRQQAPVDPSDGIAQRLNPRWRNLPLPAPPERAYRDSFTTGLPEQRLLPYAVWQRLAGRALRSFSRAPLGYATPAGQPALREAIAGHVSFTRAVASRPDDVVVTAGAQQAFDLLARILVTPGETMVALENPGYPPLRTVLAGQGARIVDVPVDEQGLMVDRLPPGVGVICVTPSHQFPLGVAMSAHRRAALLDYARRHDAVVIEDDYDGEFRFGSRPLDALQTLDRDGRVFYVGTFSKSLFPALRIGYVVAPAWARPALLAAKQAADWHVTVLAQETLAAFITEGHLARHVRKMRKLYAERRTALLSALYRHGNGRLQPLPSEAGLHLAVRLESGIPAEQLVARAAEQGIRIEPLSRYGVEGGLNGLVLGYGTIDAANIPPAIDTIATLVR